MGARTARIGFIAYAATLLSFFAVGFWNTYLMGRLGHGGGSALDWQLKIMSALYLALEVLALVALVLMSRVPPQARARRLLVVATILGGAALLVGLAERLAIDGHLVSYERMDTLLRVVNVTNSILYAGSEILLGVAGLRIAGAVGEARVRTLAIVAIAGRGLVFVLQLLPLHLPALVWLHRADNLLQAGLCIALALVVTRVADADATPAAPVGEGRLSPEWRAPADGISIYLGAAAARVVCALLSWLVMFGARSAHGLGELRDIRAQLLVVAALSAVATLVMLVGLWRLAAAPVESRASGSALAALMLSLLSFGLELWSTYITADALDGHVSAAFFAMDALPVIGAVAMLLGIGVAVSLLLTLANLATALDLGEIAARARGTIGYVLGVAALIAIGFALSRMAELMLGVAMLALPLAIVVLVQFLRVAFAVGREIRSRL